MLQSTICIYGNDNVFCNGWAYKWSPFDRDHRHLLLHFSIQNESLLSSEHVVDSDCSVKCALGQVLVRWIVTNVESLRVEVTHGPLVGYLDR